MNGKLTLEDRTLSQDSAVMARRELEHRSRGIQKETKHNWKERL
jgi:hypothetical protein